MDCLIQERYGWATHTEGKESAHPAPLAGRAWVQLHHTHSTKKENRYPTGMGGGQGPHLHRNQDKMNNKTDTPRKKESKDTPKEGWED